VATDFDVATAEPLPSCPSDAKILIYGGGWKVVLPAALGGGPITIDSVTGLQAALDGKAAISHTHAIADVTGLQAALNGKAASVHSHAIADVTGLQAALDGIRQVTDPSGASSGQVLTADGTGTYSWQDPSGGGGSRSIIIGSTAVQDAVSNIVTNVVLVTDGGGAVQPGPVWDDSSGTLTTPSVVATSSFSAGGTTIINDGGVSTTDLAASGTVVTLPNLPTSDPAVVGRLWNDGGTLKVSAG
jgi:hypothetical protein